jgi:hypothetical protein
MAYTLNKTGAELDIYFNPPKVSVYVAADHVQNIDENWTVITAPLTDGDIRNFTLRGSPDYDILYNGVPVELLFAGNAVVKVNSAGEEVMFGLFKNDNINPEAKFTSDQEFLTANTLAGLNTIGNIQLSDSDELKIKAKRIVGTGNLSITIRNFKLAANLVEVL